MFQMQIYTIFLFFFVEKVCAKMVPKLLSDEQKMSQGTVFGPFATHWEWTSCVEFDSYLWRNLGIYVWHRKQLTINEVEDIIISKTKKKNRMSQWKCKVVLIVFFDIQSIMMAEWVPSGQTVNKHYYIEVLTKLRERVRRKWPEIWRNVWILYQDSALAHNALSVLQFLANENITVLEHPPHSPDLAPCASTSSQISSQCSKEPILRR